MHDEIHDAIKASRADYTEIRIERSWSTTVSFRGARLESATVSQETGGFVRSLNHGYGWGVTAFTAIRDLPIMVARAHEGSLAVRLDTPIALAPGDVHQADVRLDLGTDVRGITLEAKKQRIERLSQEMLGVDPRVVDTQVTYNDDITEYWFANSEGTRLYELRPEITLGALATARQDGTVERGLASVGYRRGWEALDGVTAKVREAAERSVALLDAPRVRAGTYPVVLNPNLAGVFVHEAFGHLSEADFVYENPQAKAMMTLGRRFGGEHLTIGDDGSATGLRGTLPYDDEGTPTQNTLLVDKGVLVGRLHSRETAAKMGEAPTGNARALSYRFPPIVRMTNTYIGNGQGTFEDLIAGIDVGVYACDAFGGQTYLEDFSFTASHGYMIRNGQLAELIKDVVLAGNLFHTMARIDRVAGDFQWNQIGGGCGKGGQMPLPVTEGAPHVRISEALIGGTPA